MKTSNYLKILFLVLLITSCSSGSTTIEMIKENPAKYTQDYFYISNFSILETASLMNYSVNIIDDTTGRIVFISSKPYNTSQTVKMERVKYMRIYGDNRQTLELLVDQKSNDAIGTYGYLFAGFIMNSFENIN